MIYEILDENSYHELVLKHIKALKYALVPMEKKTSNEGCGVIVGIGSIEGVKLLIISLDMKFKLGTIGVTEGEKITLAFEYAIKKKLPIVAVVASGGIRVQEGTPALMQMVKISAAVKHHSNKGLLFISIITNQTLGGASAGFVSLADIIIAEKDAIYGFSGKRIINETTHEQLPDDFQTAEYAKRHGMVDIIADKAEIKLLIRKLLRVHKRYMRL